MSFADIYNSTSMFFLLAVIGVMLLLILFSISEKKPKVSRKRK